MISTKTTLGAALASAMMLGACTDPAQLGMEDGNPNQNRNQGALIGAASGAVLGALVSDDGDRGDGALIGAVLGGAVGAGVGYSLDKQEAELRQQMGSNVVITNTGDRLIVTLPQDILFATDSTALQPALIGDLRALAQNVQIYANSTLQIVGHTDSDGDAAYNQQLSEDRARAVAGVLLQNGVPQGRIQTFGRGESQPVASNLTPQGKQQNRRVEIVILPNA
ncbi:OmpA family protein [Sulfitobacter aestuariivivens]|uniref:OmpA family protein n=1 Tax=Sulfitobacter aestuariivivens TaxID=2766981 RepID=A0A927D4H4_9RHOB|nr:OmpA family protein [Sulfitobacter aestuariivivens]MBD3664819.1 OmpA family protein [Sulfitobacter aestuariivivens]